MPNHKNFYLLGLPRCRSLWLSFLFTAENSYCHHEALSESLTNTPNVLPDVHNAQLIGSADTTPLSFSEDVVQDSPLILIHRPLADVKESLRVSHGYHPEHDPQKVIERSYERLNEIETENTMHVDYGALSDPQVLLRMLKFTGVKADDKYIRKLLGSRVVVNHPFLWMLKI